MDTIGNPWLWGGFFLVVVVALLADLVLMRHGGPHKVTFREALYWSIGWVLLALAFNAGLWWYMVETAGPVVGNRVGLEFLTGYLVEKALAVDNIFVFLMLFTYIGVPAHSQPRVLVLYVFGAFLLLTGIKMWMSAGQAPDMDKNPILRWITGHLPLIKRYHGEALWIGQGRRRKYTPLFVVLVMIAVTDVIFAVDSIPAIFAITTDPFIVLTSNVFAVLGLRAMFFMLAGMADRFHLLPYGLSLVLCFIGTKMLLVDVFKIPVGVSLGVVAAVIATTVVLSLKRPPVAES